MKNEIWRDIPGYEGLYKISDKGKVKSLVGWNGKKYIKREKLLSGWIQYSGKSGYKRRVVKLVNNRVGKDYKMHQLVARAFIENPNSYKVINHIDGNPLNNNVENLEWCTQKQNIDHAIKTGLVHVIAYQKEKELVKMYEEGVSIRRICKTMSADNRTVRNVLKRNGLSIRKVGYYQNKYNIDRDKLIEEFEKGSKNVDIAEKFSTNRHLIGVYKNNWRKGELVK